MLAFLKLVTPKEWCYLGIIMALAIFSARIYRAGEHRIEQKDAALRAVAVALNHELEKSAEIKEIQIGHTYEKIIQLPAVHDAGVVCHNTAPVQPQPADGGSKTDGAGPQLPAGDFDPSGALLTLLSDDDAQIDGLIDTVQVLQAELEGKTK